jgi:hypothetical protein
MGWLRSAGRDPEGDIVMPPFGISGIDIILSWLATVQLSENHAGSK